MGNPANPSCQDRQQDCKYWAVFPELCLHVSKLQGLLQCVSLSCKEESSLERRCLNVHFFCQLNSERHSTRSVSCQSCAKVKVADTLPSVQVDVSANHARSL